MAEWLKGATLVEDTPSWLSSATLVQDRPGAFEGLGSQVVAGVGDFIAGQGMTAKELGATTVGPGMTTVGDALRGNTYDPSQRFTNPLPGDTTIAGYSADAVPALVARGIGNVAAQLPFGAAGRVASGVAGASAAFGPELEARRQRNNGEIGASDYALAGGSAALQGVLSAVGLGAISRAAKPPAGGIVGGASRVGTAAGVEGATSAAEGVISDVATNVGTKNSDLSAKSLIDAAVTGGVQGVGTGGAVRGSIEAGRVPRIIAAERAARQLDYREELPGMASDFQKIAADNNLDISNKADAKRIFEIYEANVNKHKDYNDQRVNLELNKQVAEGRLSQEDADKARAALDKPNAEGFSILQRSVGEEPFGVNAMALAKRAVNARQAKILAGLDNRSATEVTGKMERAKARLWSAAVGAASGAVLPTTFMSSIQGSSAMATLASAANVAPFVGGALAGYMGIRVLDKALGTNNPINQLVEAGARKGATSELPGKGMESPRAQKELEEARRTQAEADRLKGLRMENLTLRNDALAQMNQLRPTVVEAQNAERQARAAKTQAQAESVPILTAARQGELNAKAQAASQVAQARADATTQVATARANEAMSRTRVNEIKAEIALLRKQKLEATSKRDKKTLTGQIKNLEKTLRKAQTQESVGEGVLSGQEQPASDATTNPVVSEKPAKKKASGKKKPKETVTDSEGNVVYKNPFDAFKYETRESMENEMRRVAQLENEGVRDPGKFTEGSFRNTNTKIQAVTSLKGLLKKDKAPKALIDSLDEFTQFEVKEEARAWIVRKGKEFPKYYQRIKSNLDGKPDEKKYTTLERTMK